MVDKKKLTQFLGRAVIFFILVAVVLGLLSIAFKLFKFFATLAVIGIGVSFVSWLFVKLFKKEN